MHVGNVFRLQIDGHKPGVRSPKSSVGQAMALGRPQGRRPPASSSFCRSSYSVACGCVAAVSASMVTSESSVFLQGHWSLDQGYLTPGTNPPALELKNNKTKREGDIGKPFPQYQYLFSRLLSDQKASFAGWGPSLTLLCLSSFFLRDYTSQLLDFGQISPPVCASFPSLGPLQRLPDGLLCGSGDQGQLKCTEQAP